MNHRFFLLIPLCIMLCGCGERSGPEDISLDAYVDEDSEGPSENEGGSTAFDSEPASKEAVSSDTDPDTEIYVFVCGKVRSPGVYELKSGCRVFEALEMAGGVTEDSDPSAVNQAEVCFDGERIYIPAFGESDISYYGSDTDKASDTRININTADAASLQKINGIGSRRAEDIIAFRENNGKFTCPEDIMKVPGIKQGMFDKIKDQIKV